MSTAAGYRRGGTKGDQRAETLGSYLPDAVLSYGGALCVGEGDGGIQQDVVGDGGVFGIRQFDALDMGTGLLLEGVRGSLFKGRLERTSSCIRPPTSCTSWSVGGCWPRELLTRCSAAPTFERRYQGKLGEHGPRYCRRWRWLRGDRSAPRSIVTLSVGFDRGVVGPQRGRQIQPVTSRWRHPAGDSRTGILARARYHRVVAARAGRRWNHSDTERTQRVPRNVRGREPGDVRKWCAG